MCGSSATRTLVARGNRSSAFFCGRQKLTAAKYREPKEERQSGLCHHRSQSGHSRWQCNSTVPVLADCIRCTHLLPLLGGRHMLYPTSTAGSVISSIWSSIVHKIPGCDVMTPVADAKILFCCGRVRIYAYGTKFSTLRDYENAS